MEHVTGSCYFLIRSGVRNEDVKRVLKLLFSCQEPHQNETYNESEGETTIFLSGTSLEWDM
jgi:hypothetical protein